VCRHLAYLGPPRTLHSLLLEPPFGLHRQAWAPRMMRGTATVNADGFGVGWHGDSGTTVRYRRHIPMWTDESFPALAATVRSGAVLAAVRSATPGFAVSEAASAPFGTGSWLFSHNGVVDGWPESAAPLAEKLPVTDLLTLEAPTDSAFLWALVRDRLRTGCSLVDALGEVTMAVGAIGGGRLNLLLTDGTALAATAWGDSLFTRTDSTSVIIASEPYDDSPLWTEVPDRSLVMGRPGRIDLTSLTDLEPR
jgi:glutamine amidotransferase